jgi:2-keto-4-pentenoate hydratase/2-oxohepta-3-ene-1,7-dioic acid hydratase in catechol pathway
MSSRRFARIDWKGRPTWAVAGGKEVERLRLLDGDPTDLDRPARETGEEVPGSTPRLAPVAPSKIVAVGQNYRAHAKEMGKGIPEEPLLFLKPPSALIPSGAAIVRPPGYERTDFEGELGVVIGRSARNVRVEEALSYVFGYTVVNDVTVRDLQKRDVQYTRAKGFDTFCPVGPVVATALDPTRLRLITRQNGEVRQDSSTADLIFSVAELVSFVSQVMTLWPGDLISTGTPSGVGPITPGDRIAIEIDGIGVLENPVIET